MHSPYNRAAFRQQDIAEIRSAEMWARIRDAINREHRVLAALDPRSPRIRPTLGPLVEELAR